MTPVLMTALSAGFALIPLMIDAERAGQGDPASGRRHHLRRARQRDAAGRAGDARAVSQIRAQAARTPHADGENRARIRARGRVRAIVLITAGDQLKEMNMRFMAFARNTDDRGPRARARGHRPQRRPARRRGQSACRTCAEGQVGRRVRHRRKRQAAARRRLQGNRGSRHRRQAAAYPARAGRREPADGRGD